MQGSFGFLNSAPSGLLSLQPLLCHLLLPQPHDGGHLSGVLSPSFLHFPQGSFISCRFGSPLCASDPRIKPLVLTFPLSLFYISTLLIDFSFWRCFLHLKSFYQLLQTPLLLISPCLLMAPQFPQSLRQTSESCQVHHVSCLPCPVSGQVMSIQS